jgi:hypothetical protein
MKRSKTLFSILKPSIPLKPPVLLTDHLVNVMLSLKYSDREIIDNVLIKRLDFAFKDEYELGLDLREWR